MNPIIVIMALSLALAGCASTASTGSSGTAGYLERAKEALRVTCKAEPIAYAVFLAFDEYLNPRVAPIVNTAHNTVTRVCAVTSPADLPAAVDTANASYASVLEGAQQAEAAAAAQGVSTGVQAMQLRRLAR